MVSKLFKIAQKRSQNDPKMVQDWLKLRKIAPKTAQDSPKWVHKGSQNDPKMVQDCLKLPKIYNICNVNFHTRADNDFLFNPRFPFGMCVAISRELDEDCMSIRLMSKAISQNLLN